MEHAVQECADVAYCDTDFHRYKDTRFVTLTPNPNPSIDPGWVQAEDPSGSYMYFGGEDAPGYPNPEFDIADVDPYCAPMGDLVVDSVTSTVTARANFYECTGDVHVYREMNGYNELPTNNTKQLERVSGDIYIYT